MLKHARASESWNDQNIGQKGFTLIELLVVIIILGILAAVVVLAVNGLQDSGENNACLAEKKAVEAAAAAAYNDSTATPKDWPDTAADLDPVYLRDAEYTWSIVQTGNNAGEATNTTTGAPC